MTNMPKEKVWVIYKTTEEIESITEIIFGGPNAVELVGELIEKRIEQANLYGFEYRLETGVDYFLLSIDNDSFIYEGVAEEVNTEWNNILNVAPWE